MKLHVKLILGLNIFFLSLFVYYVFFNDGYNFLKEDYVTKEVESFNISFEKQINKYQYIRSLLKRDKYLELKKYPEDIRNSDLGMKLSLYPKVSIYIVSEFFSDITPKTISLMRKNGWTVIGAKKEYAGKIVGVFYGKYQFINNLKRLNVLKNVYIMNRFSASGKYRLDFLMKGSNKTVLDIDISLPHNKYDRTLISRKVHVRGSDDIEITKDNARVRVEAIKNKRLTLKSDVSYLLNLEDLLDHEIHVAGYSMSLKEYKKKLAGYPVNKVFLSTSDKIVFSDYIDALAKKIGKPDKTIAQIWKEIYYSLNKDIQYDYKKRKDFFSGDKTYSDIRDMYLSAARLGKDRVGACPERSSLEVAILRRIGIPSRTSTRLFHIYAEILWPGNTWVNTSSLLHAIPLIESYDENQSYFVDWSPQYPINLKWSGYLKPDIVLPNVNGNMLVQR